MENYDELTNQAKYILSNLYKIYLEKINSGMSHTSANAFGNIYEIQKITLPNENIDDLGKDINELSDKGFMDVFYGSNIVWKSSLSRDAISLMEHKFGNNLKQILKGIFEISKLIL